MKYAPSVAFAASVAGSKVLRGFLTDACQERAQGRRGGRSMGRESGGSQEQHANVSRPQGEARAAFSLHVSDFFTARAVLLCVVHAHANGGPGEAPDLEPETPEEPRVSRREEGGSLLGRALGSAASAPFLSLQLRAVSGRRTTPA